MSEAPKLDFERINAGITNRTDVFYWQTDRAVEPSEVGEIWADRHRYFTDEEIIERVNDISMEKLASIFPYNQASQTNLGNVNSVRIGTLISGEEVVIRCHPKSIRNGYFHVEQMAASLARNAGLPSYETHAIHDYQGGDDFAFQVIEKLPGVAVKKWLEERPEAEPTLLEQAGRTMANVHQLNVEGFGPFDNEQAKGGVLIGLHKNFGEAVRAGLRFNLDVLQSQRVITSEQANALLLLFNDDSLLDTNSAVLVHNDFADWNLLTDGQRITGILDWDECVASDPVSDIACWSTFFQPERLESFLKGY